MKIKPFSSYHAANAAIPQLEAGAASVEVDGWTVDAIPCQEDGYTHRLRIGCYGSAPSGPSPQILSWRQATGNYG